MPTPQFRVRERVYLAVPRDEAVARILPELRGRGRLARSKIWLDYQIAPTRSGCVVELIEPGRESIVLLVVRWLPTILAAIFIAVHLLGTAISRAPEPTLAITSLVVAVGFQIITRLQPFVVAMIYSQLIRELFPGEGRTRPPEELTGPTTRIG